MLDGFGEGKPKTSPGCSAVVSMLCPGICFRAAGSSVRKALMLCASVSSSYLQLHPSCASHPCSGCGKRVSPNPKKEQFVDEKWRIDPGAPRYLLAFGIFLGAGFYVRCEQGTRVMLLPGCSGLCVSAEPLHYMYVLQRSFYTIFPSKAFQIL